MKREPEAAGNLVRIMTVHGAKGLQAPLVICRIPRRCRRTHGSIVWADDAVTARVRAAMGAAQGIPLRALDRLRAANRQRQMEEHNRLLYVALTRAEDRLLVCGWQTRAMKDECWHSLVRRGFEAAGAEREAFGRLGWLRRCGCARSSRCRPEMPAGAAAAGSSWRDARLDRVSTRLGSGTAAARTPRPLPLAPSRPEGVELGTVPAAESPLADRDTAATGSGAAS